MAKLYKKSNSKDSASTAALTGVPKAPLIHSDEPVKLPSVLRLFRQSLGVLWRHRLLFLALAGIHALASLLLVQSLAGGLNTTGLKTLLQGSEDRLVNGILTFEWLMNDSPVSQNAATGAYRLMLLVLMSLAIIWALRQVMAESTAVRVRDAFYKGMAPLVPVLAVIAMLLLQLLPLLIALGLYNVVLGYGFANSLAAKIAWGIPALGLCILSLYLIVPTVVSLYIATLPGMEPKAALQSGREVVAGRRWAVLRKQIFLPILLAAAALLVFIPLLLTVPLIVPFAYFVGGIIIVPIVHAYYYMLYRRLLP